MRKTLLLTMLLSTAEARASDLGSDGRLHFAPDALFTVDFEDATTLGPELRLLTLPRGAKTFSYDAVSPDTLPAFLVTSDDALEGHSSLHWTASNGIGLAIIDSATFNMVAGKRLSVSFWGRSEGMEPYLAVTYGNEVDLATTKEFAWARIPAIRTGRETSDGWVEFSTGAIDGTVLERPIHDLILSARVPVTADTALLLNSAAPHATDAITIDAVEIRPADGTPSTAVCTAENLDSSCGPAGECMYGRCVDGAVTWHPVPPLPMQQEIVTRVAQWATHFLGDRHAAAALTGAWTTTTLALASADATPRSFWGGLNQQVVAIRDSHTHFGAPYGGISTPFALRPSSASGPLDVCFGPTTNDLGDGKLAYVVWALGKGAVAGLQVGDLVTQIDGMDPKAWAEMVMPRFLGSLPVDPDADWGPSARDLATLIAVHASTLTVTRCTAAGVCTAQPAIDVPSASLAALENGVYATGTLTCGPRFTDLVPGPRYDASGGELLLSAALDDHTVGIEFDGFTPTSTTAWEASVDAAFVAPHDNMIVDAREGFGGDNNLGDYLFQQFRGTDSPSVLALAARGTFSDPNDPSLFGFDWAPCASSKTKTWRCSTADIFIYQTINAAPPGAASKVAWLDTDDISNNDMVPRLLQGRPSLSIFGPIPSYGALGSDVEIPPLMPNWRSGTIAASDGRYGASISAAEATLMCQSGIGVQPDVVVTQKLSDVLAGTDTIVAAAKAWLAQ